MPPRKRLSDYTHEQPSDVVAEVIRPPKQDRCGYELSTSAGQRVCGGLHTTGEHRADVKYWRKELAENVDVDELESRLIEYTARELEKLDKLETMLGQQVLAIARGIVRGSGSELATLSKEHSRLMASIAAGQTLAGAADTGGGDALDAAERSAEEKRRRAAQAGGVS